MVGRSYHVGHTVIMHCTKVMTYTYGKVGYKWTKKWKAGHKRKHHAWVKVDGMDGEVLESL